MVHCVYKQTHMQTKDLFISLHSYNNNRRLQIINPHRQRNLTVKER